MRGNIEGWSDFKTGLLKPQRVTTKDVTKKKATHNYYRKWLIFWLPLQDLNLRPSD